MRRHVRISIPNDVMRILFVSCFAILLFVLTPAPVSACSCIPPGAPRVERDRSDAVFAGRVRSIVQVDYTLFVQMEVDVSWKGADQAEIVIRTANNSAACGYAFERGKTYLVYANADEEGALHTGICTRTARLSDAEADVEALGAGDTAPRRGGCGGPSSVAALQSLLFLGMGMMVTRRRGATR